MYAVCFFFKKETSSVCRARSQFCVQDYIGIYCCDTWNELHMFPVQSRDLVDIQFASSDR